MKHKLYIVLSLILLAVLELTSCAPAAPAVEAPAVEVPAFEPMVVGQTTCGDAGFIKEMAAIDENTVQFTLCKPMPAFLAVAAFEPFANQPKEWFDANLGSGEMLEKPIGTDPFKLETWQRGDSVILARNDEYWGEPAKAAKAVVR